MAWIRKVDRRTCLWSRILWQSFSFSTEDTCLKSERNVFCLRWFLIWLNPSLGKVSYYHLICSNKSDCWSTEYLSTETKGSIAKSDIVALSKCVASCDKFAEELLGILSSRQQTGGLPLQHWFCEAWRRLRRENGEHNVSLRLACKRSIRSKTFAMPVWDLLKQEGTSWREYWKCLTYPLWRELEGKRQANKIHGKKIIELLSDQMPKPASGQLAYFG